MVDVDGVVIRPRDSAGWGVNLEHDLGISVADLQRVFFARHWNDVIHGRVALRERLRPALAELASSVTCDRFIDYWFSNDADVDQRLVDELQILRRGGIEVHLATVQEHERAHYLWDRLAFSRLFDGMHYAAALGHAKPALAFYRSIEAETALDADSIFFIDDKAANVAAARACGWTAALWTGGETLGDRMRQQHWDIG